MTGRSWQMLAAFVAVSVMVASVVLFKAHDAAPPTQTSAEPHVGAQHHTDEPSAGLQLAPFQPYANAKVKVGDWIALEMSSQLGDDRPKATKVEVSIEAVDEQTVTIARTEHQGSVEPPTITRAQRPRQKLTLGELVGDRPGEGDLTELVVTDEAHEVGGRSFASKKLTFAIMSDAGKTRFADVEMWVAAEVPVDGVVEIRQRFARTSLVVTNRLVGFGNGSSVAWGTR